jgi:hypothetical protein
MADLERNTFSAMICIVFCRYVHSLRHVSLQLHFSGLILQSWYSKTRFPQPQWPKYTHAIDKFRATTLARSYPKELIVTL